MFSLLVQGAFWGLLEQVIPPPRNFGGIYWIYGSIHRFGNIWGKMEYVEYVWFAKICPRARVEEHSAQLLGTHLWAYFAFTCGWLAWACLRSHWPHWLASGSQPGIGGSVCCVCGARPLVYVTECSQVPNSNCGIQFQKTIGVHIQPWSNDQW